MSVYAPAQGERVTAPTCCINPLAIDVYRGGEICHAVEFLCCPSGPPGKFHRFCLQLMPHWKFWPQTLHSRLPTPAFLSSLTTMDFSWLQNRHVKTVGSGSFWMAEVCLLALRASRNYRFQQRLRMPFSSPLASLNSCACPFSLGCLFRLGGFGEERLEWEFRPRRRMVLDGVGRRQKLARSVSLYASALEIFGPSLKLKLAYFAVLCEPCSALRRARDPATERDNVQR